MSSDLLDKLTEEAKSLTKQERQILAARLMEDNSNVDPTIEVAHLPDEVKYRKREYQWIKEHSEEYAGQWVAIEGDKLFAHGLSARQVLTEAKKAGAKYPFIARMDSPDDIYFTGGW